MKPFLIRVVLLVPALCGVAAAPPATEIQLRVTYRDATAPVADGVRSDGLSSFTGLPAQYVHGTEDNVLAILQTSGNFRFSTRLDDRKPLRRRLCLDLGTQTVPFAMPGCTNVLIGMHGDGRIQDMDYGEVLDKRVKLTWNLNGFDYHLGYGTDWNADGTFDTVPVTVNCTSAQPGLSCNEWLMSTTGPAALWREQVLRGGKYGPREFFGFYDMPFEVSFAVK